MTTVTLCGSARFETTFKLAMKELTLRGLTVIGLATYPSENEGTKEWYTGGQKEMLDLVHLNKVLLADAIVVIDCEADGRDVADVAPYVGYSTAREVLWALMHRKRVVPVSDHSSWDALADEAMDESPVDNWPDMIRAMTKVLDQLTGKQTVAEQVDDTKLKILHAGLSFIACANVETFRPANVAAESWFEGTAVKTLQAAGLDPMDSEDVESYLLNTAEFIDASGAVER